MRALLPVAALSLMLLAAGCGATPAAVPLAQSRATTATAKVNHGFDYDKETQEKIERGELSQRYGSFFFGNVDVIYTDFDRQVKARLTAVPGSETPGTVSVVFMKGISQLDPGTIKVGDKVQLFVSYTLVEVKTGKIWDIKRPYQAFTYKR
jgi:hypothetical protein